MPVDTLPLATAATRNGKYLLVLNCGFNQPSISVIDIAQKREIGRTPFQMRGWALLSRRRKIGSTWAAAAKRWFMNCQ